MSDAVQPEGTTKPCRVCPAQIPDYAERCSTCKSAQGEPCVVCGERLLPKAKRCNACQSFQHRGALIWKKIVSLLAAWTPVAAVVTGVWAGYLYIRDYDSDTHFKFATTRNLTLYLNVWNSGNKPSSLLHYRLIFEDFDLADVELVLIPEDQEAAVSVIASGKPVKLGIRIPHEPFLFERASGLPYTKDRARELFKNGSSARVRLDIDVEESSDSPGSFHLFPSRPFHTRSDWFTADRVSEFILDNMSDERSP